MCDGERSGSSSVRVSSKNSRQCQNGEDGLPNLGFWGRCEPKKFVFESRGFGTMRTIADDVRRQRFIWQIPVRISNPHFSEGGLMTDPVHARPFRFPSRVPLAILLAGILRILCALSTAQAQDLIQPLLRGDTEAQKPLPAKADLRDEFERLGLKPLAQGDRDTCGIFVMTTLVEFEIEHNNNALAQPLSEEYTCWAARKASGKSRQQAMFFELTAGVEKLGACTSVLMPYSRTWDPDEHPSQQAIEQSMVYRDRWRTHWIRHWAYKPRVSDHQMDLIKRAIAEDPSGGDRHALAQLQQPERSVETAPGKGCL
jgi:hypothetical protein